MKEEKFREIIAEEISFAFDQQHRREDRIEELEEKNEDLRYEIDKLKNQLAQEKINPTVRNEAIAEVLTDIYKRLGFMAYLRDPNDIFFSLNINEVKDYIRQLADRNGVSLNIGKQCSC